VKELFERYERNFLRNDFLVCLLTMAAIFLLDRFLKWDIFLFVLPSLVSVYPTIATGSLTIFVFLLTCISIIIAFLQNKKLEQLAASGQPRTILRTFFSAIRWFGILTLVSFIAPMCWSRAIKLVFFWGTFSLFCISLARLIRAVWVIKALARLLFLLKDPEN
jgi:uncharacterized membrane protein